MQAGRHENGDELAAAGQVGTERTQGEGRGVGHTRQVTQ